MKEREIVAYFRSECRNLRTYVMKQKYYSLKTEELSYKLTNIHPAGTDRISSTSTFTIREFNYELAADLEACETLADLYLAKINSVRTAIEILPVWIRPNIIKAYVKEMKMRDIAKESGMTLSKLQEGFYRYISICIKYSWVKNDMLIKEKILATEKNVKNSIKIR